MYIYVKFNQDCLWAAGKRDSEDHVGDPVLPVWTPQVDGPTS